jgi:hypothetical protein
MQAQDAVPPSLSPPWRSVAAWQEANASIDFHLKRYYPQLKAAMQIARQTRERLESVFPLLDEICRQTCPWCPDPCCLTASPWYDFRDLVFLHLNGLAPPSGQAIDCLKATCRYASLRGCTLPRIARPWICTWYLCPVQSRRLRKAGNGRWEQLGGMLTEIKNSRRRMEDAFIRGIS